MSYYSSLTLTDRYTVPYMFLLENEPNAIFIPKDRYKRTHKPHNRIKKKRRKR